MIRQMQLLSFLLGSFAFLQLSSAAPLLNVTGDDKGRLSNGNGFESRWLERRMEYHGDQHAPDNAEPTSLDQDLYQKAMIRERNTLTYCLQRTPISVPLRLRTMSKYPHMAGLR